MGKGHPLFEIGQDVIRGDLQDVVGFLDYGNLFFGSGTHDASRPSYEKTAELDESAPIRGVACIPAFTCLQHEQIIAVK